jgi:very-short-patch-repair endonuclease
MTQLTLNDYAKQNQAPPLQGRGKGWGLSADRLAELHKHALSMRRNPTEPEKRLWRYLSNCQLEGFKFRRQDVVGHYIADFACPSAKLIVEIDGDTHDAAKDRIGDDTLAEFGFRVVRVTNADVLHNMEGVLTCISEALRQASKPHPNPSPEGEGGVMGGAKRYLMLLLATAASAWLIGAVGNKGNMFGLIEAIGFALPIATIVWLFVRTKPVDDLTATIKASLWCVFVVGLLTWGSGYQDARESGLAVGTAAANSLVTGSGFAILVSLASLFWLGRNRQEVEIDQNAANN